MSSPVCTSEGPTHAHRACPRESYCPICCESLPSPTLWSSLLLCTSTNISQGALCIREYGCTAWSLIKDPSVPVPQEMLALKGHGRAKGLGTMGPKYRAWWMEIKRDWIFMCILRNLWVCSALTKHQTQNQLTLTYTTPAFRGYERFKGRPCYIINQFFLLSKSFMTFNQGQSSMVQKASTLLLLFRYKSIPEALWV